MEWKSTEKAGIRGGEVGGGRLKFVYFRFAVDNTNGTECARLVLCPDTWAVISSDSSLDPAQAKDVHKHMLILFYCD